MRTVKVTTTFPAWPLIQQTPAGSGVWGGYRFVINQPLDECDYWIVYEGLLRPESTRCTNARTLLITAEPPNVRRYNQDFATQFGSVMTVHDYLRHPRLLRTHPCLPWHVGRHVRGEENISFDRDYDRLKAEPPAAKQKLLSVITSDKTITAEHRSRIELVRSLKEAFGDELDVFGRGIRDIEDKWDAIAPYRYHIVLENGAFRDYWTEKIADAYLAWSYPFYLGCPNLADYFPCGSFTSIDFPSVDRVVQAIREQIRQHRYEDALKDIEKARSLCLDVYNFFSVAASWCDGVKDAGSVRDVDLEPESAFSLQPKAPGASGWSRILGRVRRRTD